MSNNLVFHRARIGGLDFEALMSADGPAIVVRGHEGSRYEGWVPLGVSRLRWFGSAEPGGRACPQGPGWHLVKYFEEVRAYLPGFGQAELRRLREEFGLLTDAELERWSGEPTFYSSRAWAGLVQWAAAHPWLARRYAQGQAYLLWYDRAHEEAARAQVTPA
ncbi:MAG: hypothetical protein JO110_05085 [Acetobacteraceae bacterium]|nr:hypothetical protein [Acetobacteraceae bacterium]